MTQPEPAAPPSIVQPAVAQLPWAHNVLLMQSIKDEAERAWYAQQALSQGWSRNVLKMQISSRAHERKGYAVSNFAARLPSPHSDLVTQALKDPYLFDFLTLRDGFLERELETGLGTPSGALLARTRARLCLRRAPAPAGGG